MERDQGGVACDSLADVAWALGGARYVPPYYFAYGSWDQGLWRLDLSVSTPAWQLVTVTGPAPAGRMGQSLTLDPVRRQLVLFGGRGVDGQALVDVWTFNGDAGTSWSAVAPTGPPPPARAFPAAVLDAAPSRPLAARGPDRARSARPPPCALALSAPPSAP